MVGLELLSVAAQALAHYHCAEFLTGIVQFAAPHGAAVPLSVSEKAGTNFMPHNGQSPAVATFTEGCIGQV